MKREIPKALNKEHNLTEGSIAGVLITFAIPFLIANILQALYGAVDLMIVSRYCEAESVSAVSVGTQVTQIITSLVSGLTLGGTVLVGKYTGQKDKEKVKTVIGTTLTVFAIVAIFLTFFMLCMADTLLNLLNTPREAFDFAKQYVSICFCGIFFICGYNAISAILRGYGDSKHPMIFVGFACVLNIVGDIIFVRFCKMGAAGTAFATVLAQAISMITAIIYLNRNDFIFKFRLQNFRIDIPSAKELFQVGFPISLQEIMVRISFLYLTMVTNQLGVYASSAVGIASKYDVFAILPATSIANALAALTAQNYGANKMKRANKSLVLGTSFAFAASACFFLWAQISPETMIGIFSKDANIIKAGVPFFTTCSYDYLAVTLVFCMNGYLNGRTKTFFTMVSCCFGAVGLRIPLIYLAHRFFPDSLFVFGTVAPGVSAFMAVYTFFFILGLVHKDGKEAYM